MNTRTKTDWRETSKSTPCFGCGKHGYCSISADGTKCLCRRGATSEFPVKQKDGSTAYLHGPGSGNTPTIPIGKAKASRPKLTPAVLQGHLKQCRTALSPDRLTKAAASLGLITESLQKYGVGWFDQRGALSFPMWDGDQRVVGFRLRYADGSKGSLGGDSSGLFLPDDFDVAIAPDPWPGVDSFAPMVLLPPEGPTDCAAAWQCGFQAIGRPSCSTGGEMLARLLFRCHEAGAPRDVVVVADADATHWMKDHTPYWPGWEGAVNLAEKLLPYPDGAGTTNDRPFLGLSTFCVTFAGIEGEARIKDDYRFPAATNPATVAFEGARETGFNFHYDSRGIILADGVLPGRDFYTGNDLSSVTPGTWVLASTLGLSAGVGLTANYHQTFLNTVP